MTSYFHQDSIFWVELDKIRPNPYQPRKEFDDEDLQSLANSIRQYGVLQALVVTRQEVPKDDGGLAVEYELISGERRLRAAKLAGIEQIPVLIRSGEESNLMKLELAIIENLQREDLNVVERARAFEKLAKEFSLNNAQIARKVGKSREYVSNTQRVLTLPEEILNALSSGKISEGHARPLLTLSDRPEEQTTLFKEIMYRKLNVRDAERIAKRIAKDRVRKREKVDPELEALEKEFTDSLGTRVHIETREVGGKISIDYFSDEDLRSLLGVLKLYKEQGNAPMLEKFIAAAELNQQLTVSEERGEDPVPQPEPPQEADARPSPSPLESAPGEVEQEQSSDAPSVQVVPDPTRPRPEEGDRGASTQSTEDRVGMAPSEAPAENGPVPEEVAQEEPPSTGTGSARSDGGDLYSVRNFTI